MLDSKNDMQSSCSEDGHIMISLLSHCLSANGAEALHISKGNMDGPMNQNIIEDNFIVTLED